MTDDAAILRDLYRDKLSAILRHQAGACHIRQYDANNTYQYIINREEMQLSWIGRSIAELGANVPAEDGGAEVPASANDVLEADIREAQAFVDRWTPRTDTLQDARYRGTLRVILGETLEQKRFFEQALAGNTELLGKRTDHVGPRVGEVLSTRWIG